MTERGTILLLETLEKDRLGRGGERVLVRSTLSVSAALEHPSGSDEDLGLSLGEGKEGDVRH